jgi:hypothetical protein
MGIAKGAFSLLCDLKKTSDFGNGGKILQLGRQLTFVSPQQINEILSSFSLENLSNPCDSADQDDFGDQRLFKSLGFNTVESIDNSSFENATYVHDFNHKVPPTFEQSFDCIFDGGTIEHIFDIRSVLTNIHKILKVGGYIIHASPSSNHVDHGFYMFSPTLFHDYYQANGYEIVKSYLFEYESSHDKKPWIIYDYTPGCIDHLSFGGWNGDKLLGIWFVARKLKESTCHVIPQQGSYRRAWANHNPKNLSNSDISEPLPIAESQQALRPNRKEIKYLSLLKNKVRTFKGHALNTFRRRKRPPVIAKY